MKEPIDITLTDAAAPPSRPRHSLQRKLAVWTLLLVLVPTVICVVWLNVMARRVMTANQWRSVALVANTAAASMVGQAKAPLSRGALGVSDGLVLDKRVCFVIIADAEYRPVFVRVVDSKAWAAYSHWHDEAGPEGLRAISRPISLSAGGDVVAWKSAILNPPRGPSDELTHAPPSKLEGFVVLAMRDENLSSAIAQLQSGELLAALLVCGLSIPVVMIAARRWTAPLRLLLDATNRLAQGFEPPRVNASSNDELGQLTEAFNLMGGKLHVARAELEAANAGLEEKVQQRTGELQRAKRELEIEITEKNEFLRAVSHDLGAPLRNIGGMAAMLLTKYKAVLADDALNKLERISANVRAQTDLINDLLELSRIKSRPGKRQEVDLHALVQELVEALAFDLDKAKIGVEIRGRLPVVLADRNRMRQVFQNLIDNAIKYMLDSKERKIFVGCRDEGDRWSFNVTDTGRGIDARDLPGIFQLYRRAAHSGSHHVPGRGVGLANVRTIVETYGGHIAVQSELGKGSTFTFTLEKSLLQAVSPMLEPPAETPAETRVPKLG